MGKDSDFYTKISLGDETHYGEKLTFFNDSYYSQNSYYDTGNKIDTSSKIAHGNIINPNVEAPKLFTNDNSFLLQNIIIINNYKIFGAKIMEVSLKGIQKIALTWYYEKNEKSNYYIQVLANYKINVTNSLVVGGAWMGIGTGFKLYNN